MTLSPIEDQLVQPVSRRSWNVVSLNLALIFATIIWMIIALNALYSAIQMNFFTSTTFIFWLTASSGTLLLLATLVMEPIMNRIKASRMAIILLTLTLIIGTSWASKTWVLNLITNEVATMSAEKKTNVFSLAKLLVHKTIPELAVTFGVKDRLASKEEILALRSIQLSSGIATPLKLNPIRINKTSRDIIIPIYSAGLTILVGSVLIIFNIFNLILMFGRVIAALIPKHESRVRFSSLFITIVMGTFFCSDMIINQSILTGSKYYQSFYHELQRNEGSSAVRLVTFSIHTQRYLLPLATKVTEEFNLQ